MPEDSKRPRLLACARCFRLKRKCDHTKPTCGECRRRGAECLPVGSCKNGDDITIPLRYLKYLESRVAELEGALRNRRFSSELCDAGVQTDSSDESPELIAMPLDCSQDGLSECVLEDHDLRSASLISNETSIDQSRTRLGSPHVELVQIIDPQPIVSKMEGSLISKLAYEVYPAPLEREFGPHRYSGFLPTPEPINGTTSWNPEVYGDLYFSITHWVWPFLDRDSWRAWRHEWTRDKSRDQWKGFFVHMVHAIGALSCNNVQLNQCHSVRAAELYVSAMSYYPCVMEQASTVLQIQASVLMILYALQCPSAEEISTTVSSIIPFCTATIAELRRHTSYNDSDDSSEVATSTGEFFTESLFITCYMLNEIIVSGWDRPVSEAYKAIDDDMFTISNKVPSLSTSNTALSHLFRLRKIQADIRRYWSHQSQEAKSEEVPRDDLLKSALDTWRNDIPQYGLEGAPYSYLHPLWMANLYDYSIIILMQEKRHNLKFKDIEDALCAIVEVCLNFRQLQEEGQVMCYTWSALVFQFRAGIMLLYIFWVAPREQIFMQQALEALEACLKTIDRFADRWHDAAPYKNAFVYLVQKASWVPKVFVQQQWVNWDLQEMDNCLTKLKKQYLHKGVLEMIEDMVYRHPVKDHDKNYSED